MTILRLMVPTLLALSVLAHAQFGQNKVQYKKKHWQFLQTTHFDIYYAEQSRELAVYAAGVIEPALDSITRSITYPVKKRIPVIIYKSQSDFQQTNVILDDIDEGTGGFTEIFKSRIVVPFTGSYADFRHVIHHELTHAVMYDLIFENVFNAFRYKASFQIPLWVAEGWAEYESAKWNLESDMYLMDAVVSGYIDEPRNEFGSMYLAYKAGMAFYNYMAVQYGSACIGEFLKALYNYKDVERAFRYATHDDLKKAGERFLMELKKKYWPELGRREHAFETARRLTEHRAAGYYTIQPDNDPLAHINIQPSVSPDGRTLAYFSDREDFIGIYLLDARTGKRLGKLAESGTSDNFESFHSYKSGIAWSPDGARILFVAQTQGQDAIRILDVKKGKVVRTLPVRMERIEHPDWSPDGNHVVFSGLVAGSSDLYTLDIQSGALKKITADPNYDTYPRFSSDGKKIVFVSEWGKRNPGSSGLHLFLIGSDGTGLRQLTDTPFDDEMPVFSNDDKYIYFVSNRSGLRNLYVLTLDSLVAHPLTNIFTGCFNPSLSRKNDFLAFSVFSNGGWDIYRMDEPLKHVKTADLPLTDYARSLTDSGFIFWRKQVILPDPGDSLWLAKLRREFHVPADTAQRDSLTKAQDTLRSDSARAAIKKRMGEEADDSLDLASPFDPYGRNDPFAPDAYYRNRRARLKPLPADTSAFLHDTLAYKNLNGSFRENEYLPRFTFDAISAMAGAAVGPGGYMVGGSAAFALSDILGNHHIEIMANIYGNSFQSTWDAFNGYVSYYYLPYRLDVGGTLSRYVNIFGSEDETGLRYSLYVDAIHNASLQAQYPFSRYLRLEGAAGFTLITRATRFYNWDTTGTGEWAPAGDRDTSLSHYTLDLAGVFDNTLWGHTGPVNGERLRLSGSLVPYSKSTGYGYGVGLLDTRTYFHFLKKYVLALRFSAGASAPMFNGTNPHLLYLGGVPGNLADLFMPYYLDQTLESNYYSSIVMPLRGYTIAGANPDGNTQYTLANAEFRFPFIQNLSLYFPLPISINYVMGALFIDGGAASNHLSDVFPLLKGDMTAPDKNEIKGGAGFGLRMNLFGGFVIKWDRAWRLGPSHPREDYVSLGAEF
ncbi:MAG: hypothetical protein V1913_13660 [Fibrobacterota bacterium]